MTPPLEVTADTACDRPQLRVPRTLPVPHYLQSVYWWAYVHPRAVRVFERDWLVNLILFGNYSRLRDRALAELGVPLRGSTLQVACVYGDLTLRLRAALACDARLEIVDILPIQLTNLRAKLPVDERVTMLHGDSSSLAAADGSFDQLLLFFLLHEQPEHVRRATLAEALRVTRPGGKIVIVDYHRPARWHPMRPLMRAVFRRLEPYAIDLWRRDVAHYLPEGPQPASMHRETFFGGLYQKVTLIR
jgi:ubiquinone/menaquinone biosynthesis C-methylase UbiE